MALKSNIVADCYVFMQNVIFLMFPKMAFPMASRIVILQALISYMKILKSSYLMIEAFKNQNTFLKPYNI